MSSTSLRMSPHFPTLPRLPSELDVIIVRKEGIDQSYRHFHVRRSVVHRALQWLVMYNKYYRPIDGNTLDQLPEDGNLAQLRVIAIDSPTMDSPTSTTSTTTSSSAPITSTSPDDVILTCNSSLVDEPYNSYCAHLPQLFVPTAMRSMTEQEAVVNSVEERQSSSSPSSSSATLMWPSNGGMTINEFTTEGYFTCVFPTFFPTGVADFSGQGRQNQVTIFNKHITTVHI